MSVAQMPLVVLSLCLTGLPAPSAEEAAVAADEAFLKGLGLGTDGPALLDYFRKNTLDAQQRGRLEDLVRQLGEPSFRVREKASAELTRLGRVALTALRRAAIDADRERARRAERCLRAVETTWGTNVPLAAARLLAHRAPAGALGVLIAYLPATDDLLLDDSLLGTVQQLGLRDGQADSLLVKALTDRNVAVRQAAVWVVGRTTSAGQRMAARPLLKDADPGVRLRAAQALLAGKDKEAAPALVRLLGDAPLEVARHAEDLLYRLAGERAPAVSFGLDDASRRRCQESWERWWRDHGATLDLAKFEADPAALGYTMICVAGAGGNNAGKVWETGRDGKVRWEVGGLQFPVEAEILPGNRVLIGEQGARRVTERDFAGKILWEHQVIDGLVGCQRLPNGNTFIVTHRRIFEVDAKGKESKTHLTPNETLWSGQKLPNGNILYLGSRQILTELDGRGQVVRSWKVDISGIGLVRATVVPGGVLIGERNRVVQYNHKGEVVWQSSAGSAATSAVRLPNGNVLVCCYIGSRVVEVDRNGNLVSQQSVVGSPLRIRRR